MTKTVDGAPDTLSRAHHQPFPELQDLWSSPNEIVATTLRLPGTSVAGGRVLCIGVIGDSDAEEIAAQLSRLDVGERLRIRTSSLLFGRYWHYTVVASGRGYASRY